MFGIAFRSPGTTPKESLRSRRARKQAADSNSSLYLVFKEPTPSRFRRRIPILLTIAGGRQDPLAMTSQDNRRPPPGIPGSRPRPAVGQGTCPPTTTAWRAAGFRKGSHQGSWILRPGSPAVKPPRRWDIEGPQVTPGGLLQKYFPATTYSPTHLRAQYHRR